LEAHSPLTSKSQLIVCLIAALAAGSCRRSAQAPEASTADVKVDSCSDWLDYVCAHVSERDSLCLSVQESVRILSEEACAVALGQRDYTGAQLEQRKQQCGVLVDKACTDMPKMQRFCKQIRERVLHYTPDFCVDMLRNYPRTLEQLKQQATADRLPPEKAALLYGGDPPAFGPKDGPIQVVEFIDYESAYSPQTAAIVRTLAAKYASQMHFVMRQFPLTDNPHAYLAAQAALAANAQGKYWQMHDKLLDNRAHLERADLLRYGKELGLDVAQLKAALDHKRYAPAVDADLALVKALQVIGMPTLFVNGERILNSVDEAAIADAIQEYLANAAP
jgi:protein-disulfide isomerase